MKTVLFTDLDDTLFSTARKQAVKADFVLGSILKDGSASGWLSPTQQAFLAQWQNTLIIPVTARNYDAFSRVKLSFSDAVIINHGGVILDAHGNIDTTWHEQQLAHAAQSDSWLEEQQHILRTLADELKMDIRIKINSDYDLRLYVLLKSNQNDDEAVARLAQRYQADHADTTKGYVHCNGNNLAILPNWLNKASAVNYLKNKLTQRDGELLTLGCGDSLSDLGFMQCCDFWLTPKNSQISDYYTGAR